MGELTEDTDKIQDTIRLSQGDARRFCLVAEEVRGWHVDIKSVRQLSPTKMIAWATYRKKPIRVMVDTNGFSMMQLTQEECQLIGILAMEVWPE